MRLNKVIGVSSGEQDFQAPKPLSDILKKKRKVTQENGDNEGNIPTKGQGQAIQSFNLSKGNDGLPPPEKDVEEGELPVGDSDTFELPTFTPGVDDTEASNDVDTLVEDKPSAFSNRAKPVVVDEQEDAVMNDVV